MSILKFVFDCVVLGNVIVQCAEKTCQIKQNICPFVSILCSFSQPQDRFSVKFDWSYTLHEERVWKCRDTVVWSLGITIVGQLYMDHQVLPSRCHRLTQGRARDLSQKNCKKLGLVTRVCNDGGVNRRGVPDRCWLRPHDVRSLHVNKPAWLLLRTSGRI